MLVNRYLYALHRRTVPTNSGFQINMNITQALRKTVLMVASHLEHRPTNWAQWTFSNWSLSLSSSSFNIMRAIDLISILFIMHAFIQVSHTKISWYFFLEILTQKVPPTQGIFSKHLSFYEHAWNLDWNTILWMCRNCVKKSREFAVILHSCFLEKLQMEGVLSLEPGDSWPFHPPLSSDLKDSNLDTCRIFTH